MQATAALYYPPEECLEFSDLLQAEFLRRRLVRNCRSFWRQYIDIVAIVPLSQGLSSTPHQQRFSLSHQLILAVAVYAIMVYRNIAASIVKKSELQESAIQRDCSHWIAVS